jgi:hypothetical protein
MLQELLKNLLAKTNDYRQAARTLEKKAWDNRELYDAITKPYLAKACYAAVCRAGRVGRKEIWDSNITQFTAPVERATSQQGERLIGASLYMFRLLHGQPLGEADKEDVEETARFYESQADNMAHKARWLTAIAAPMTAEKVKDLWSEDALAKLQAEV